MSTKKTKQNGHYYVSPHGPSDEERKTANIQTLKLWTAVITCVIAGLLSWLCAKSVADDKPILDVILGYAVGAYETDSGAFPINAGLLAGFPVLVLLPWPMYHLGKIEMERKSHYAKDEVVDTGGFMTKEELEDYESYVAPEKDPEPITEEMLKGHPEYKTDMKYYSKNLIMSDHLTRPANSRNLIGNNNIMVVGGAGTGKSRFFIKPNVLQMNCSYVITDPSGEMIYSLGHVLETHGYRIKIFNISDMSHSNCYNPLHYIRDEAGVKMLIECLINNTTQGKGGGDQFFTDAEKLLYSACIFYLLEHEPNEAKQNFAEVITMINKAQIDETGKSKEASPLDEMFEPLPDDDLAKKYYRSFSQAAGKTLKSIVISCVTRLQPFLTPQVVNLTSTDTLELETIGNQKTALFIITPQADRTYSFLASMLYSQLFETLYHIGESQKANGGSEQLHIPVRCMMDEFANIGEVPEFPSKLSTMRKYNISASIVLQDIAQIEAMYKDDWKTLVGNCSTYVFLGTQEPNTLKYFSDMLGQKTIRTQGESSSNKGGSKSYNATGRAVLTTSELGRLPPDECVVFTQNQRPVKDKKYRYENHPYYPQTADADNSLGYRYNTMPVFDNTLIGSDTCWADLAYADQLYKDKVGDKPKNDSDTIIVNPYDIFSMMQAFHTPDTITKQDADIAELSKQAKEFEGQKACLLTVKNADLSDITAYAQRMMTDYGFNRCTMIDTLGIDKDMSYGFCIVPPARGNDTKFARKTMSIFHTDSITLLDESGYDNVYAFKIKTSDIPAVKDAVISFNANAQKQNKGTH